MAAKLLEGVAGSGKSTYIANYVLNYGVKDKTLLITFSRTGREVLQKYIQDRNLDPSHYAIHTIDGLATRLLFELGDNYSVLKRDTIARELLPSLLDEVLRYWPADVPVNVPLMTASTANALLDDIDFFRATGIDAQTDADEIEQIVSQHLHHDWRLVQRLMWSYDRFRDTWLAPSGSSDEFYEDFAGELPWRRGEQGFRQLSDAVSDLLSLVEDSDKLQQWGRRYHLICIDEFHDTSPLQLTFLLGLARGAQDIIAVGDRFQNIYAWRGTNTAYVFETFARELQAQREELNTSYRYAQSVADLGTSLIQRDITSAAKHSTKTTRLEAKDIAKLSKETVLICQDPVAQVEAAFFLWRHTKHKTSYPINHSLGPAILNVLICLRYAYLLDAKSPILKNLKLDLSKFLALPQCYLSEMAKQEMLKKPAPETLAMYFSIHLQAPAEGQMAAYSESMRVSLLQWLSENREKQTVYEIMQWFEESTRLWSSVDLSMAGAIGRASWEALKEDAASLQYTLAQWPERFESLNRSWSERAGMRIRTVAQAKGQEYDEVLVFDADREGFTGQAGELARNQIYIAMTRAKKQLYFLPLESRRVMAQAGGQGRVGGDAQEDIEADIVRELTASPTSATPQADESLDSTANRANHVTKSVAASDKHPLKRQALAELAQIKENLLKRGG